MEEKLTVLISRSLGSPREASTLDLAGRSPGTSSISDTTRPIGVVKLGTTELV